MIDHGCLTMVNHGSTMVKTSPDHGSNECLDIRYLTMIDHDHLIFECGTDHG